MRFILMDTVYLLVGLAVTPWVVYRMVRYGRYLTGWSQRFGNIFRKDPALKKCVWLHAVSVGEVNAAKTLVSQLHEKFGDFEIIITTATDTGFAQARSVFGEQLRVFYFPLDFSPIMRRAFRNIRPSVCLLMELEVWPNFVQIARQLRIPVVVVNGRISDNSFAMYSKIKPLAGKIFRKLNLVLAQTDEYARRFRQIGCPQDKVFVTGSLKYDTAQLTDKVDGADELARQLDIGRQRLWVAGGTGPGEEQIILEVFRNLTAQEDFSDLRLAIVPRKPERFDEVAQLITGAGFDFVRYSELKKPASVTGTKSTSDQRPATSNSVILGDTMGDLRKFYSLATVIFVGRSLVPMGGSDMAEAAALGKCTLFGPHTFNFKQTVDALLAGEGAVMVKDKDDLFETMRECLAGPALAARIARNGQDVIRKNQGATAKTIKHIEKYLNSA
jgi:3-deoxy-D-manno-octulosonic-acid transferase